VTERHLKILGTSINSLSAAALFVSTDDSIQKMNDSWNTHGSVTSLPMYHNRDDIMGTFTRTCARTYNFPHLSRTLIRYSINVVRCAVKKGTLNITRFLLVTGNLILDSLSSTVLNSGCAASGGA